MPLRTDVLLDYYYRRLVDAWNATHPYQEVTFDECDVDEEDRVCELIAMPKLVNHILDKVVAQVKKDAGPTVGALRFCEEFEQLINKMRPDPPAE